MYWLHSRIGPAISYLFRQVSCCYVSVSAWNVLGLVLKVMVVFFYRGTRLISIGRQIENGSSLVLGKQGYVLQTLWQSNAGKIDFWRVWTGSILRWTSHVFQTHSLPPWPWHPLLRKQIYCAKQIALQISHYDLNELCIQISGNGSESADYGAQGYDAV